MKTEVAQERLGKSVRGRATISDDASAIEPVKAECDVEVTKYGKDCDGVQDVEKAYDSDEIDKEWNLTLSTRMARVLRYEAYDTNVAGYQ